MHLIGRVFFSIVAFLSLCSSSLYGSAECEAKKTQHYVSDGTFFGGTKLTSTAELTNIRRANSGRGFERIVFDLSISKKFTKPPYFQAQIVSKENKIVVSFWGDINYSYDPEAASKAFQKSRSIQKLEIVPRVEEGLSIVEIQLKPKSKRNGNYKLEAFYLMNPARVILDIL